MNAATRKKLFDALTADILANADGNMMTERFVTEIANQDLDRLAPAVDKLLSDREAELLKLMPCGHPTAELELAPLESQPAEAVISNRGHTFELINAEKACYLCAGCRRHQEFVRRLVEHLKAGFASSVFAEALDAVLNAETASIT